MGKFIRENLPDPISFFEVQGLKLIGKGKWRTTECRFHDGSDSMRVNTATGGWVCMNCNARGGDVVAYFMAEHGVDFITATRLLGAWQKDGTADRQSRPSKIPASQALQMLARESHLAAVAAGNLANCVSLADKDRARLYVAARRINHIAEFYK